MSVKRSKTLPIAALTMLAAAATTLLACGGGGPRPTPAAAVTHPSRTPATSPYLNDSDEDLIGDQDDDNTSDVDNDPSLDYKPDESHYYHDEDDGEVTRLGRLATSAERQSVQAFVRRYYALAGGDDGAGACRLMLGRVARLATAEYGAGSGGSTAIGGGGCRTAMDSAFKRLHKQVAAPLEVTEVRVSGSKAYALLGSRASPASYLTLQKVGGNWRAAMALAFHLP